ncbi:MAG: YqiA/YcfP family alpha/beta fold hydrolase [Pseudomonadota bacterium]|nr:YqiA/YcfP family alpha/beta fold hydrolase [Pseudomonadota bacterium]
MKHLIYVHGFLSAPGSHKATLTKQWLQQHHPEVTYHCPHLSPYPLETERQLTELMSSLEGETVGLIGSSLGGFWSTWLVERYGVKAVLINPSVRPFQLIDSVVGETLDNYYTNDTYTMQPEHGEQLRERYQARFSDPTRYWVLVQTGDETLDYRQAVERYVDCRVSVEEGGDHGFQHYDHHLPEILNFLFK